MAITRNPLSPGEDVDHGQPSQPLHHPQPTHPPQPLHQHTVSNASTATVDIEAWTVAALESLSIAPIARGTGNTLSIPLDGSHRNQGKPAENDDHAGDDVTSRMRLRGVAFGETTDGDDAGYGAGITPPRRLPSRRDSMRRREALLKGKEGSRQRRRWENDRLLHVPNVQPPLPSDWQVHPTYPVHGTIPYQLAQYWDKGLRERAEERKAKAAIAATARRRGYPAAAAESAEGALPGPEVEAVAGHVPRDLRATAKRTPAVKSWLRVLEEPVRQFVLEQRRVAAAVVGDAVREVEDGDRSDETDPDDEEIVFVGRNGLRTRDGKPVSSSSSSSVAGKRPLAAVRRMEEEEKKKTNLKGLVQEEEKGLILDTLGDDAGGAFKRWLTHSISDYYGLDSKSVTVGNPARRVVYVRVKQAQMQKSKQKQKQMEQNLPSRLVLPPPLWEMF
ncbi:hypothetical protein N656DRAFT_799669 [Canariomyces notabilis]|uniref:R3H-associated N-terminal domain-containing protein n=1 Tax=Canariomyces notabilis TaxID=2074819 RepID=A0AAN6QRD9_9PEZI|nr:hypothetical protein N656DRAFT_799669 [Canariomyces arenarius]